MGNSIIFGIPVCQDLNKWLLKLKDVSVLAAAYRAKHRVDPKDLKRATTNVTTLTDPRATNAMQFYRVFIGDP